MEIVLVILLKLWILKGPCSEHTGGTSCLVLPLVTHAVIVWGFYFCIIFFLLMSLPVLFQYILPGPCFGYIRCVVVRFLPRITFQRIILAGPCPPFSDSLSLLFNSWFPRVSLLTVWIYMSSTLTWSLFCVWGSLFYVFIIVYTPSCVLAEKEGSSKISSLRKSSFSVAG